MTEPSAASTRRDRDIPLDESIDGMARFALDLSGITTFTGAILGAVLHTGPAERTGPLAIAIGTTVLWTLGYLPRLRERRALWQITMMLVLLASPLLTSTPATFSRLTTAGAICITAALALPRRQAVAFAVGAILVDALLDSYGAADVDRGAPVPWWVSTIMLAALTVSVAVQRVDANKDARLIDDLHRIDRESYEQERRLLEVTATREAVDRRIHETVLNTLTEVSVADDYVNVAAVQRSAADDLARLDWLPEFSSSTPLSAVLATVTEAASQLGINVDLELTDDPVLTSLQASVLRDAVIEALRNVARHSGTNHARIEAAGFDDIVVRISDDGVGIDAAWTPGLGTRLALRSSLTAIGGAATIAANDPSGSIVTIKLPLSGVGAQMPMERAHRALASHIRSVTFWLGASAPAVVAFLAAPAIAASMNPTWPVTAGIVAVSVTTIVLALTKHTRARFATAAAAALAIGGLLFAVARTGDGCMTGDSTRFALMIALLATPIVSRTRTSYMPTFAINLAFTAATMWVAAASAAGCGWVVGALIPIVGLATGTLLAYWWHDSVFLARVSEHDDLRQQDYERDTSAAREEAAATAWRQVDSTTRSLLGGLADGTLSPASAEVRSAVGVEATLLRTRLGLTASGTSTLLRLLNDLATTARHTRTGLDVQIVTEVGRVEPLPAAVVDTLKQLIASASGGTVRLRAFYDQVDSESVVASAPAEYWPDALAVVGLPPVDGAARMLDDCHLEVLRDESGAVTLLISWSALERTLPTL